VAPPGPPPGCLPPPPGIGFPDGRPQKAPETPPEAFDGIKPDPKRSPEAFDGTKPDRKWSPEAFDGAKPDRKWSPEAFDGTKPDPKRSPEAFDGTKPDRKRSPEGSDGLQPESFPGGELRFWRAFSPTLNPPGPGRARPHPHPTHRKTKIMASQQIPEVYDPLIQLAEDAADGAHELGAAVGLKQNDEDALRAVLEDLTGTPAGPDNVPPAVPGLKAKWNNAKTEKGAKSGAFRTAKSNGRTIAAACIGILKPRLGNQWTNEWQNAGFTGGSLALPDNCLTLLQQLRAYFAQHPTHEKVDLAPGINATAAACEAAAQAISSASTASNNSNTASGLAKSAYEAGVKACRNRLTALREELNLLLGPEDERWYSFGFDRPGDPETPEVPDNLTTIPGAPGSHTLFIDWDDARRAEGYRVTLLNAATNDPVDSRLTTDSEATFTGLPAGISVKITITARLTNGAESPASPPLTAAVP